MLLRNMLEGAVVTRDAYLALLDLKSLIEVVTEKTRTAEFETIGKAVSSNPSGNPLLTLKAAADALHGANFENTLVAARDKVESAMAWHQSHYGTNRASAT